MVERYPEEVGVVSSILTRGTVYQAWKAGGEYILETNAREEGSMFAYRETLWEEITAPESMIPLADILAISR